MAYQVAVEFALLVNCLEIRDPNLRDQITRASQNCAINIGEAAGLRTLAHKAHVFTIARGEATEAAGTIELGMILGKIDPTAARACMRVAGRLIALLSGLIRRR